MKKYLIYTSLVALAAPFYANATTCSTMPDCAALGYKHSAADCETMGVDAIKCPFDDSKAYCALESLVTCEPGKRYNIKRGGCTSNNTGDFVVVSTLSSGKCGIVWSGSMTIANATNLSDAYSTASTACKSKFGNDFVTAHANLIVAAHDLGHGISATNPILTYGSSSGNNGTIYTLIDPTTKVPYQSYANKSGSFDYTCQMAMAPCPGVTTSSYVASLTRHKCDLGMFAKKIDSNGYICYSSILDDEKNDTFEFLAGEYRGAFKTITLPPYKDGEMSGVVGFAKSGSGSSTIEYTHSSSTTQILNFYTSSGPSEMCQGGTLLSSEMAAKLFGSTYTRYNKIVNYKQSQNTSSLQWAPIYPLSDGQCADARYGTVGSCSPSGSGYFPVLCTSTPKASLF